MGMDKQEFEGNLLKTIEEIKGSESKSEDKYLFLINPIDEPGKTLNSKDDYMRLAVFNAVADRYITLHGVVGILTNLFPLVPLWIEVSLVALQGDTLIFQLDCSKRFRKESVLKNQETGHPPFKARCNGRQGDGSCV